MIKQKKYLLNSIKEIEKNFPKKTSVPSYEFDDQIDLNFRKSETRLVFSAKNGSPDSRLALIRAMISFASKLDLFNRSKECDRGCHICVNISPVYSSGPSDGFIHLDPHHIFPIHPNPVEFYESIKEIKEYFIET